MKNKFKTGEANINYKHGATKHPLYSVWTSLRQRCNDKNCIDYARYGGRGITYNKRWESFSLFLEDMKPSWVVGLTLDRIDVNGNYSKENCRFADRVVQANNRRNTKLFEFAGEAKTLTNWAKEIGKKRSTLAQRIYVYKWSVERTLTT